MNESGARCLDCGHRYYPWHADVHCRYVLEATPARPHRRFCACKAFRAFDRLPPLPKRKGR